MRVLSALLILVLALAAGCAARPQATGDDGGASADGPRKGGTLIIGMRSATTPDPNPNRNATIGSYAASELVADPLARWEEGDYVGVLAESWETSPDGKTWTFHLRSGVKFHNGVPLTAEAVRATMEYIRNPADPLPGASALANVEEVTVVDELTFRLQLKRANPEFLLDLMRIYIVEPGSLKSDGPPAGTGPYIVTKHVPDHHLILDRFSEYWAGEPYLDRVVIRAIPEGDTLVLELEAGTVALILFTPSRAVKRLQGAGFQAHPFVRVNTARLAFNLSTVTDVRLRRAICYAVDRDIVIRNAYSGFGIPQHTLAVQDGWAYDDKLAPYTYDPGRARAILDEAGWVDTDGDGIREMMGKPINLHLPSRGDDEDWLSATQIIQQMLKDVGIGSYITTAERLTYYDAVRKGKFDITWWISNYPPEPPISATHLHSETYWNVTQLPNPEIDSLIDKARSTVDRAERVRYYHELQRIHLEQALECLVMWVQQIHVASPRLQGLKIEPTGVAYNGAAWWLKGD